MNIGKTLKNFRKAKFPELKQKEYAEQLGLSPNYLSQIEQGIKRGSLEVLERVAEHAQIPLPLLLWYGIEEEDIKRPKRKAFELLKPTIDTMIESII